MQDDAFNISGQDPGILPCSSAFYEYAIIRNNLSSNGNFSFRLFPKPMSMVLSLTFLTLLLKVWPQELGSYCRICVEPDFFID
jgi:hypothetical protein